MHAILLVGGKGTRLAPLTRNIPKPLIRFGPYSILEITLRRLHGAGFRRVTLCISHLGELIREEFGDGRRLGLAIDYSLDAEPLGTAAPLLNVTEWDEPAVVMNGDILTTVDFADLHRQHTDSETLLTVAFHRRRLPTSVGMLHVIDQRVRAIWEKPSFNWNVNSGIYVANPLARKFITEDEPADMPDLINAMIDHDEPVNGYGFAGPWHDIGTHPRYRQAKAEFLADPELYLDPRRRSAPGGVHLEPDPLQDDATAPDLSLLLEQRLDGPAA
ncbi:nucleotidyltransferase family protein [Amycolatopsis sp. H20-H5]|uniref:nucleotidyltransferase family protein n=1 Tax=Amycolatopsis sp. H20-H5 TaxID=3046309 RepID=UPI002DBC1B9D|nr:sugar phosphate nucleotidyltransferase [Amycolatopsis sp. H20-H5]MEC3976920.1 sugar phosphate nucleotidyltransferase [Amycolatopsis sp. H20-H5]